MKGTQRALGVLCVLVLTWLVQVDQTEGQLRSISVGPSGVWVVEVNDKLYYSNDTYSDPTGLGSNWIVIPGLLKQVDVGTNIVWGVDSYDHVYYRKGISPDSPSGSNWETVNGRLKHVTVSPRGSVWGIDGDNDIYYRQVISINSIYNQLPGDKCLRTKPDWWFLGASGGDQAQSDLCWRGRGVGVTGNKVYYRQGTYGDTGSMGSSWTQVGTTKMTYVTSGDEQVLALDRTGKMASRKGMTSSNPTGTHWSYSNSKDLKVIDSYRNVVWSVDNQDNLGYATIVESQ